MLCRLLAALFVVCAVQAHATTWYVRTDGGTRYSANVTTGQCDGTADAAYPGSGVNQHCAFNDVRMLWSDGTYCNDNSPTSTCWKWVGAGGDTYIIRGSIADGVSYRIGQSGPNSTDWQFGIAGNPYASAPPPPSGSAGAHTQILGGNYASCSAQTARTQLHGGYGVGTVFDMTGTSYVDLQCLDITDFSSCGRAGQTHTCNTSYPLDDYAGTGIYWTNTATNDTVTNVRIHGMAVQGMLGSTGDGVVLNYIVLIGNPSSGWNADAGNGFTGMGHATITHYELSWNGCAEEYPIVDAVPYQDCTDDNSSGYGDAFGTSTTGILPNGSTSAAYSYQIPIVVGTGPDTYSGTLPIGLSVSSSGLITGTPTANGIYIVNVTATDSTSAVYSLRFQIAVGSYPQGWQITFDQGTVSYNTQDGLDALHLVGLGSSMTITRTLAFGNMGNQIKIGGANGFAANNVIVTNCNALRQAIPGTPSGYNSRLSDFCRAGDTGVVMTVGHGTLTTSEFNTVYSASSTGFEVECDSSSGPCDSSSQIIFRDNIFLGFLNNTANGYPSGGSGDYSNPIYVGDTLSGVNPFTNAGSVFDHNLTYHWKSTWSCPATWGNETNALCVDPGLTDEVWHVYGYGNTQPSSALSAVVGAGVTISGITTDYAGATRPNPPSIGAYELSAAPPSAPLQLSGVVLLNGVVVLQ